MRVPMDMSGTLNLRMGHRICSFSNPVSHRGPLTCYNASRLRRCHRALVSNSCHFFRTPLAIPLATFPIGGGRAQPVRKVPSRDGYPRGSSRTATERTRAIATSLLAKPIRSRSPSASFATARDAGAHPRAHPELAQPDRDHRERSAFRPRGQSRRDRHRRRRIRGLSPSR